MNTLVSLFLAALVKYQLAFTRTSLIALLCIAVGQSADLVPESLQRGHNKRTLHVMDYGYALPIEITAVRGLQNAHWVRDLEVELKNISAKPIYEVYLTLFMPDDSGDRGNPSAITLEYGRFDLIHPVQRPSAEDRPIRPGESVALRVAERARRGYEHHLQNQKIPTASTYKVRMIVLAINFGDGTGFINGGVPYPGDPNAPKPKPVYARVPVESNAESLQFRFLARPPIDSGRSSQLATGSVHKLDVCCPSSCDGNLSNNDLQLL